MQPLNSNSADQSMQLNLRQTDNSTNDTKLNSKITSDQTNSINDTDLQHRKCEAKQPSISLNNHVNNTRQDNSEEPSSHNEFTPSNSASSNSASSNTQENTTKKTKGSVNSDPSNFSEEQLNVSVDEIILKIYQLEKVQSEATTSATKPLASMCIEALNYFPLVSGLGLGVYSYLNEKSIYKSLLTFIVTTTISNIVVNKPSTNNYWYEHFFKEATKMFIKQHQCLLKSSTITDNLHEKKLLDFSLIDTNDILNVVATETKTTKDQCLKLVKCFMISLQVLWIESCTKNSRFNYNQNNLENLKREKLEYVVSYTLFLLRDNISTDPKNFDAAIIEKQLTFSEDSIETKNNTLSLHEQLSKLKPGFYKIQNISGVFYIDNGDSTQNKPAKYLHYKVIIDVEIEAYSADYFIQWVLVSSIDKQEIKFIYLGIDSEGNIDSANQKGISNAFLYKKQQDACKIFDIDINNLPSIEEFNTMYRDIIKIYHPDKVHTTDTNQSMDDITNKAAEINYSRDLIVDMINAKKT